MKAAFEEQMSLIRELQQIDLNLHNLPRFCAIPGILEVSIGHALICDALYYGLENTIQLYLRQLVK